ncbi:MAG: hypothetical protein LBB15_01670, partial [Puniceicoccales bacterium]|nr:hypothetical protein [Puniceicoccales bacterium]
MDISHLANARRAAPLRPPEAEVSTSKQVDFSHQPFPHHIGANALGREQLTPRLHVQGSALASRSAKKDGKETGVMTKRLKIVLSVKSENKPPSIPVPSADQAVRPSNSPVQIPVSRPRAFWVNQADSGARTPSADRVVRPNNNPVQIPVVEPRVQQTAESERTLSSAQFAEALGYRIVDCGGSGNNCMILSALTARDRRNGTNPPAGGYREEAEQLRQKILAEIDKDLQIHVFDLEHRLANIGMSEEEIATIVEQAKSLAKRGVNKELDKAEMAQLRTQVTPKIASWLKMGEESDAVSDEYNDITKTMGRIGDLSFLRKHSTTGESLYIEIAGYIARIFGCDVAVVVKFSRISHVHCFQAADGTHAEDFEGRLTESVIERWKAEHG